MLKAITFFISFLLGRMDGGAHPTGASFSDEVLDKAVNKLRGLISTIATGWIAVIFTTAGFLGAFYNLLSQIDTVGAVTMNAVMVGGICLFAFGLGLFAWLTKSTAGKKEVRHEQPQSQARAHSGLEEALSLLILDHVKEREYIREMKRARQSERSFQQQRPSGAEEDTVQASVH